MMDHYYAFDESALSSVHSIYLIVTTNFVPFGAQEKYIKFVLDKAKSFMVMQESAQLIYIRTCVSPEIFPVPCFVYLLS